MLSFVLERSQVFKFPKFVSFTDFFECTSFVLHVLRARGYDVFPGNFCEGNRKLKSLRMPAV